PIAGGPRFIIITRGSRDTPRQTVATADDVNGAQAAFSRKCKRTCRGRTKRASADLVAYLWLRYPVVNKVPLKTKTQRNNEQMYPSLLVHKPLAAVLQPPPPFPTHEPATPMTLIVVVSEATDTRCRLRSPEGVGEEDSVKCKPNDRHERSIVRGTLDKWPRRGAGSLVVWWFTIGGTDIGSKVLLWMVGGCK
ncbi:hypothetical protein WN55_01104, partial [Dufourea novaeangliae]